MRCASLLQLTLVFVVCLLSGCAHYAPVDQDRLRRDVSWLADDARGGRLPGTTGSIEAATYIEQAFMRSGLRPAFGESYRQSFALRGALLKQSTTAPSTSPASLRTDNVAGILPGWREDEYVVIGAHYDHLGRGRFGSRAEKPGQIHNGADDNASGTAAMLEVMRSLAAGPRLRSSVLFVAFSAEESGLIGSNYFVKHSPVPTDKMLAMINLDMVGRVRKQTLFVGGGGTRADFESVLKKIDDASTLSFKSIGQGGFGPSDHQSFAKQRVPVLFFFSGLHQQYHHPDDDTFRVNFSGLADVASVTRDVTIALTQRRAEQYDDRFDGQGMDTDLDPSSQPTTGSATGPSTHSSTQRKARASLGVIPDYGSDLSEAGVRIGGAVPESPAAGAGLVEGDVIVGFADKLINNLIDLSDALAKATPGDTVRIRYVRAGIEHHRDVKLSARR